MMATSPEVPLVCQALWAAGAVVTPVVFLVGAAELRHILLDSGAAAVVTSPELARHGAGGRGGRAGVRGHRRAGAGRRARPGGA
ncbi:AMP-binding protein [Nonomuraea ferruginea]